MKTILSIAILLAASPALASELPADEIVKRARAVHDQKYKHFACKVDVDTEVLDKNGKVEHHDTREGDMLFDGDEQDFKPTRGTHDSKEMSARELADEQEKAKKQRASQKDKDQDLSPLAASAVDGEQFELLRRESLWGHDAYVIKVTPSRADPKLTKGTLWIDAAHFVELKGELEPSKMPDHADWLKFQEQFTTGAKGEKVPVLFRIEGAGHFMFVHKGFRTTFKWRDCR